MTSAVVGALRYCPACARPLEIDPGHPIEASLDARCACCDRPWIACECSPAYVGEPLSCEADGG